VGRITESSAKSKIPSSVGFYEIEAEKTGWSVLALVRQIHSFLFARLLKCRDNGGVLALAGHGQTVSQPIDVIKQPYVLDFLDLPDQAQIHESDLETAIIENLQPILLKLGKGFSFVGRQYRIATESQHFFIDLMFYNFLLKCFVLIELLCGRLHKLHRYCFDCTIHNQMRRSCFSWRFHRICDGLCHY
jgi:predicted nuclease of restriction endonuclease-like (RecB) superfamily